MGQLSSALGWGVVPLTALNPRLPGSPRTEGQLRASSLLPHLPASLPGKTSFIYILFPRDLSGDPGPQKGVFH